jgi:hypothetical protein
MGNTFTIYDNDKHFVVNTVNDIYAFALVGLSSPITFSSGSSQWTNIASGTFTDSGTKYNYIFKYTSSASLTDSWVFNLDTGLIPSDTIVHVTNNTSTDLVSNKDTSTPLSDDTYYSIFYTSSDGGIGGGDPHIIPYFNPSGKVYVLETNDSVYKYFDNLDPDERVVMNTKMWVLDNKMIYIAEKLQRDNSMFYEEAKEFVCRCVVEGDYTKIDTSFAKYVSVMYKTKNIDERLIIDVETLDIVSIGDVNEEEMNQYKLNKIDSWNFDKIKVSNIKTFNRLLKSEGKVLVDKNTKDSVYRSIEIKTKKHGILKFNIIRIPSRINHRNHIEVRFKEPSKVNVRNCCGTLISLEYIETVPSIYHVNHDMKPKTRNKILLDTRKWRKMRAGIIKTERVKMKRYGKGILDFYSEANEFPEREYHKYRYSFPDGRD